ncbi:3-hydroxybenzoate 6-monooxygenase [Primorskyibacter sp. 2E107]|uniref:3-hydroxybenzoate 6-monooxygenase n=1 Tax=Primorskyibacter sp. 2E107 TaxID=3403458 RepID=UPI003AF5CAE5
MTDLPILIAGGGIGGLAAACGLARKGLRSIVFEQASKMGEIGAGIQIGPNAFHCFDYLGIGDEARAVAVYIDALRLMDAQTAEDITHIPLDEPFRKFYGNPYAVVHRADLHGVLLKFCEDSPLVDIRTSHAVTGYAQDGDSATVLLKDRDPIKGLFLIAAEGLRSPIRAQLVGDGAPRISGHTTYRSVIPKDQMPEDLRWNAATLWAGPKCHIVHYPLKGGKVYNLVVTYHRDVREAIAGRPVSKEEVAQGFEHIHPKARQIIEHGENWKLWVLCDRDPISNWVDGRVALLGDSAHPMLQYFAQGACMAMEDAVALSHCMAMDRETVEGGLQRYQGMRRVRTARVQMNSRLIGEYIYHPDDAKAAVRNHVMKGMLPDDWYRQLNWLYGSNGLES